MSDRPANIEDAARQVLSATHTPAGYNEYGACKTPGYRVDGGRDGMARAHHVVPNVDLLDPDRPSDDALAEERQRMVLEYADALEAAGWTVIRRGPRSRSPYLLAARP